MKRGSCLCLQDVKSKVFSYIFTSYFGLNFVFTLFHLSLDLKCKTWKQTRELLDWHSSRVFRLFVCGLFITTIPIDSLSPDPLFLLALLLFGTFICFPIHLFSFHHLAFHLLHHGLAPAPSVNTSGSGHSNTACEFSLSDVSFNFLHYMFPPTPILQMLLVSLNPSFRFLSLFVNFSIFFG